MILLEAEPPLPLLVQGAKVQVVAAFQVYHALKDFVTVEDLTAFLDRDLLPQLAESGCPPLLSRVVMFARSDAAVGVVARRMAPGAAFYVWKSPDCWLALLRSHGHDLQAWARRAEPNFGQADLPQGLYR